MAHGQCPLQRVRVTTEIFPSGQGRGLEACLPHSDLWLQGRPGFPRIKYSSMQQLQPKGLPFWQVALFGFCSLTVICFLIVGVGKHGCSQKKCPSLLECYIFLWVLWSRFYSHLHSINIYWSINKKVARKPLTTPLPHFIKKEQMHFLLFFSMWTIFEVFIELVKISYLLYGFFFFVFFFLATKHVGS